MGGRIDLKPRLFGILAIAVSAALVVGCGTGDSKEATASAPLTKKEFLKQGNTLCDAILGERDAGAVEAYKEREAEIERLQGGSEAGREHLEAEVALEVDLPLYRKLVHKLGELTPPAKDAKTVGQMLSRYEALLDRLFEHPEKLKAAEPLTPNKEAASYGLVSCNL